MFEAQQDFQRLACQPLLALEWLIGIGVHAQCDRLRHVAGFAQLGLQAFGEVRLGDQLGFEIDAGREIPIGMGRTRKAVDAAMPYPLSQPLDTDV